MRKHCRECGRFLSRAEQESCVDMINMDRKSIDMPPVEEVGDCDYICDACYERIHDMEPGTLRGET
jgi:hypothetical protein